jgi:hypothetical protein
VVGIGVEAPVARCLLGRLGDVIDDEGDEFQGISRLVLNSRQGASKMAAIDIYDVMPDFITGKRKDEKGRGITNWTNIGADRSANINAGQAVNEAFYSWHHQRSQVPKVLKAIHGWAELSTCQNEQNSCFIYGDWNHRCYRAFLVFARLAGDAELERKLVAHNRNMMIVLALSATHQRRETRQSTGVQTVCCGHRSWIAAIQTPLAGTSAPVISTIPDWTVISTRSWVWGLRGRAMASSSRRWILWASRGRVSRQTSGRSCAR